MKRLIMWCLVAVTVIYVLMAMIAEADSPIPLWEPAPEPPLQTGRGH